MPGEKPDEERRFFKKLFCAVRLKERNKNQEVFERGHRGGGKVEDVFILPIQDVLCELCG